MGGPKETVPPPSDDKVSNRKRKFELMVQYNKEKSECKQEKMFCDHLDLPPEGQPSAPSTGLPGSLNNAANFQKVCFIHIYEEAQNK